MRKKQTNFFLIAIFAVMLTLLLAACGENNQANLTPTTSANGGAIVAVPTITTAAAATIATSTTSAATTVAATTAASTTVAATIAGDGTAAALDEPMPGDLLAANLKPGETELVLDKESLPAGTTSQAAATTNQRNIVYIVAYGDTLSGIAFHYRTTVQAIANANGIANPSQIFVGQRLTIPTGSYQPQPSLFYVVQSGDTAYSIARRFGTSVEAIVAANKLADPRVLRVGQRLVIPGATTPGNVAKVYIVQPGDTLFGIAAYFGTTTYALARDNYITNTNRIYVGQRLVIRK